MSTQPQRDLAQPSLFDAPVKRSFSGSDYRPALDEKRLRHQIDCIRTFMLAQTAWLTLEEIVRGLRKDYPMTGFPENSVQAQLRNLRKEGLKVEKRRRGHLSSGLYEWKVS